MFFFSRFISVVPSRLTWDGLSSWGLSRGIGMGQEEDDLPQPEPLCRHLSVSVLACLPVSCAQTQKSAASRCTCALDVYAYCYSACSVNSYSHLMWYTRLPKRHNWVYRHSSSSHTHSSSVHIYSPALCRAYITVCRLKYTSHVCHASCQCITGNTKPC